MLWFVASDMADVSVEAETPQRQVAGSDGRKSVSSGNPSADEHLSPLPSIFDMLDPSHIKVVSDYEMTANVSRCLCEP